MLDRLESYGEEAVDTLISLARHFNRNKSGVNWIYPRQYGYSILVKIGGEKANRYLEQLMMHDEEMDPEVNYSYSAFKEYAEKHGRNLLPFLHGCINSKNPYVNKEALLHILRFKDQSSVTEIEKTLVMCRDEAEKYLTDLLINDGWEYLENFENFAFQANFSILVSAFKDDSRL